ncbi:MAG TPA: hypothetical protein PLG47_05100 [Candidatus Dojkabacteria bacterium]|nr:hypothetical protein [Candidatus Dojkabacteria bacterium]
MKGIFNSLLKKQGDKLVHIQNADIERFKEFVKLLEEGVKVNMYIEVMTDDGSLEQIAKVHKCIRVLASTTGNTFEEMKKEIKERSGLNIIITKPGETIEHELSFGDCSRDDLNVAIQACIELGDELGINLR